MVGQPEQGLRNLLLSSAQRPALSDLTPGCIQPSTSVCCFFPQKSKLRIIQRTKPARCEKKCYPLIFADQVPSSKSLSFQSHRETEVSSTHCTISYTSLDKVFLSIFFNFMYIALLFPTGHRHTKDLLCIRHTQLRIPENESLTPNILPGDTKYKKAIFLLVQRLYKKRAN